MKKRLLSFALAASMVIPMATFGASAGGAEKIEGEKPYYNAQLDRYEISTPAQLYYLSGDWKDGAPRDGHYVLTADIDMEGIAGFKPIAAKKAECFTGTFDGQFYSISNLRIEYEKKYSGLFGYVGNEDEQAYIQNLALVDTYITGQQNVGDLVVLNYVTVTGCVVTGEIICLDLSNAHTVGGICGKLKEGEGPIVGRVEDCYVDAVISGPYDVGGIAGIQDGGGYLARCFAAGEIVAYATSGT